MSLDSVLILARKHLDNDAVMASSARFCFADAIRCKDKGNYDAAKRWAVKSLAYSVGIFHADYKKAAQ